MPTTGAAFMAPIFLASSMILVLWSLLNVSQSVVSERTHRTFDFWRTTRLSPLTLALGKLFGAPLARGCFTRPPSLCCCSPDCWGITACPPLWDRI